MVEGDADLTLAKKLRMLKEDLKKWNKEAFGKLEDRKNKALARLLELDHSRRFLSPEQQIIDQTERISIKKQLKEVAKAEEITRRQKSRCLWIKQGVNVQNSSISRLMLTEDLII